MTVELQDLRFNRGCDGSELCCAQKVFDLRMIRQSFVSHESNYYCNNLIVVTLIIYVELQSSNSMNVIETGTFVDSIKFWRSRKDGGKWRK